MLERASFSLPSSFQFAMNYQWIPQASPMTTTTAPYGPLAQAPWTAFGSLWIDANNAISSPSASTAYEPLTSSVHIDFDAYQFATSAWTYVLPTSFSSHLRSNPSPLRLSCIPFNSPTPLQLVAYGHACYTTTPLTHLATSAPHTGCYTHRLPY